MKKKLIFLLLTGMLFTGCSQNVQPDSGTNHSKETTTGIEENQEAEMGEEATQEEVYVLNFEASTIDGEAMTSEIFSQSKLTMINVWATYCNPCLKEMPDLGEIAASYDQAEFQMIGIISDVTTDATEGDLSNARDLITQTGANYPHLLLNESLHYNLVGGIDSVPTTFFVNKKGEVLGYTVGSMAKEDWEEIIYDLLEKNS